MSFEFIDKAKLSSYRVIVHWVGGICRSATVAITYILKTTGMSSVDAHRLVKDVCPSMAWLQLPGSAAACPAG
jgi:protein-tyrosine phosphatase